jgi:hypothetical protein
LVFTVVHETHVEAAPENCPVAHAVQLVALTALAPALLDVPASQVLHAVLSPVSSSNLPAGQFPHAVAAAVLNWPARQLVHDCCPVEACWEPAKQFLHVPWAVSSWYVLTAQALHAVWPVRPSVDVPAAQSWHAERTVLPAVPNLPAAQAVPPEHELRPSSASNVPGRQSVQLVAAFAENLPGVHRTHFWQLAVVDAVLSK